MLKKSITRASSFVKPLLTLKFLPEQWRFVVAAFLVSKVVIIALSFTIIAGFEVPYQQLRLHTDQTKNTSSKDIESFTPKSMWLNWDSYIYHGIASEISYATPLSETDKGFIDNKDLGRSSIVADRSLQRFAFAPMYPLLTKAVSKITFGHYTLAMLIISNAALIGALYYLYSLVFLLFKSTKKSKLAVIFMLLLPTSFLLHAALSESLFLFFLIASIYYAFKNNWMLSGLLGAGVALTRSSGIIVPVVLAVIMLHSYGTPRTKAIMKKYLKALPWLLMPWVAWGGFMLYCYLMTGDLFAYSRIQYIGWGVTATSPLYPIINELFYQRYSINTIKIYIVLLFFVVTAYTWKKIPIPLSILSILLLLTALSLGDRWPPSILRYTATMFPIALSLTVLATKYVKLKVPLIASLAAVQSLMLVFWVLSWTKLII